jgi:hypothetical protein
MGMRGGFYFVAPWDAAAAGLFSLDRHGRDGLVEFLYLIPNAFPEN